MHVAMETNSTGGVEDVGVARSMDGDRRTGCCRTLFQVLQLAQRPPRFLVTNIFGCFNGLCRPRIVEVCLDFVLLGFVWVDANKKA